MKKILLWLLLAAVLALPAPAEEMTTTVLMYVAGDDLESVDGIAMEDFAELIYTDIAEEGPIRVLALTGGCEYWWYEWIPTDYPTVHSFDSHAMWPVNEWEPANMGDPETLRQFISYGLDFDPSDRTILVLWGHGDGPVGGVCSDGLYDGDFLTMDELEAALDGSMGEGEMLDAVIFDSCLIASVDYAEMLDGYAKYMVASQDTTVGTGLRYDKWVGALTDNPGIPTEELCRIAAETYAEDNNHGRFGENATMSVMDLQHAQETADAVDALYAKLMTLMEADESAVSDRRAQLVSFGEYDGEEPSDQVDAKQVIDAFRDVAPEECRRLEECLEKLVICNAVTDDMAGKACGLSLMMPYSTGSWSWEIEDWYMLTENESAYSALNVILARMAGERYKEEHSMSSLFEDFSVGGFVGDMKEAVSAIKEIMTPEDPADMWEGFNP